MLVAIALKFLYANPGVSPGLAGSKKAEHVLSNIDLLELPIDESVYEKANRIALGLEP